MFTHVGNARKVVVHTSANFTEASTDKQWNDMQVFINNTTLWNFFDKAFDQMEKDKVQSPLRLLTRSGAQRMMFTPIGRHPNPFISQAKSVYCKGATNTYSGRTVVRYFPDVMRGDPGLRMARQLRRMWDNGCNVKIGYTIMDKPVHRVLRDPSGRGPVPLRHLAVDRDGDGEYDLYAHMKSMSIRGRVGRSKAAYRLINGTSNVSRLAQVSDENIGINFSSPVTRCYESWMNRVFQNPPRNARMSLAVRRAVSSGTINPYAGMEY